MAINYVALATELTTDPQTYGYAALISAGSDAGLADLLNKVRDGTDGEAAITVRRADIAPNEILEAIDNRDFITSPNIAHASWFESVTQLRTIRLVNADGTNTRVLGNLRRLVNDTQGSQTRLDAIAVRNGSRAEQLFGVSTSITADDIARALRG